VSAPRDVIACALTRPDHTDPGPHALALSDAILKALDEAGLVITEKWTPPSCEVHTATSPPFTGQVYWFRGTG
jgi:hypothetical protein